MNRNGDFPLNRSHESFQQLCALLPSGELNQDERGLLAEHLRECSDCRSLVSDYTSTLACWASTAGADRVSDDSGEAKSFHFSRAKASLFARIDGDKPQIAATKRGWHLPIGY